MGYARPTETRNPPEAFAQALAVAQVKSGKRMSPGTVVLGLFARGYPVPIDQLRRAVRGEVLEGVWKTVARVVAQGTDASDVADAIAIEASKYTRKTASGRFMLERSSRRSDRPASSVMADSYLVLVTAMLGGDLDPFWEEGSEALDDLVDITDLKGLAEDRTAGIGAIVPGGRPELRRDLLEIFRSCSVGQVEDMLDACSYEDLVASRDLVIKIMGFGQDFAGAVVPALGGPEAAYGLKFMTTLSSDNWAGIAILSLFLLVQVQRIGHDQVSESVAILEPEFKATAATTQLLERLPESLYRFIGPGGARAFEKAGKPERDEFTAVLKAMEREQPGFLARVAKQNKTPMT
jgi:hypothetical protein